MLCILEGQARTGKTTVAGLLLHKFRDAGVQARIFKSAVRSINPAAAIITQLLPLCFDEECVWICDRAHVTEQVYTTLYSREQPYPAIMINRIDELMSLSGGALLFHLTANRDTLEERMTKTNRQSEGDITEVRRLFDLYVRQSVIQKRNISTSTFSLEETVEMIYASINFMTAKGETDELDGSYDYENVARPVDAGKIQFYAYMA